MHSSARAGCRRPQPPAIPLGDAKPPDQAIPVNGFPGEQPSVVLNDRGTYVVQGERITDPVALATLRERGLPDHETAVEIPAALLRFADPIE